MQEQHDEVAVLVAGAGPAGLTAAIALARQGVETLVLERRPEPSDMPRATAISTANMELMRAWGLEERVRGGEIDAELRPLVCRTLAEAADGQPFDAGFPTREQSAVISPTSPACVPQDHLEPVLEEHLGTLPAARIERGAELIAVDSGEDGVEVTARDVASGRQRRIRARYLIGADGIRSAVRSALGIEVRGCDALGETLVVVFRAPLWELTGDRRNVIYPITGAPVPCTFVPVGKPDRWVMGAECDPADHLDSAGVAELIRQAAGDPDLRPRIERIAPVTYGVAVAERFRQGSAFLAGDAAHRVTPRGATGMNTAIRSGYDLGWKLAWVLNGWAGAELLDSYERERRPVAEHNADRSAGPNGSRSSVTAELRADLGGRIAHAWLPGEQQRVSTLDLLGPGLTLLAGPDGAGWANMTPWLDLPIPLNVHTLDALTARALGLAASGALLVRPDGLPIALWTGDGEALLGWRLQPGDVAAHVGGGLGVGVAEGALHR